MSFPRYPEYKDSGVEWLGEVPAHWDVLRLKRIAALQAGETIKPEQIEDEGSFPVFGGNGFRGYTSEFTHDGEHVLIGRQGALCGNINYAEGKFWASEHAIVATPKLEIKTKWLGETLRAMNLNQYSTSAAQPGISVDVISKLLIPAPNAAEQSSISDFLEYETTKIDALIAEQKKLIDLLKEKRQAVISHAVTKGLDPNVKMKDSGIEWLGEVPGHWEVVRIKHLIQSIEQGWSPQCESFPVESEEEWGVLKVGCVNGGFFNSLENKKLPAELAAEPKLGIKRGDLLISRANTRELVGSAAVAEKDYPNLLLCDKLYRLRLNCSRCEPEFLARYLATDMARGQIEIAASGASSSMLNIGQAIILEMPIALPEKQERQEIMEFIGLESKKIGSLIAEAFRGIDLLKERRSALISAAVTGKIDVRGAA